MKICPNCGAENEDNALTCILCEFEFEVEETENHDNENYTQHDALEHEVFSDISAATDDLKVHENESIDHSDNISLEEKEPILNQHRSKAPIAAIIAIICIIIAGGSIFGIWQLMKNKNKKNDNSKANDMYETSTETTSATEEIITTTAAVFAESTTQTTNSNVSDEPTEPYVQENVTKDEINRIYVNIINETDFPVPYRGFITDLNNDDVNELIVPDTDTMSYIIYYYKNGTLASQGFGSFMSLDNFQLYKVSGDNGTNYIYYRDNYSYMSKQGYFSFSDMTQLNIFIDYPENNGLFKADWSIDYNETENYAKGNEPVDTFYAQPADCHKKLMSALPHYGFTISENTSYTTINGLYKDELIKKLSNNDNTAKKPTISAYIEGKSYYPIGDGIEFILHTSGDYSYYHYEGYETGGGEYDNKCASVDTSESEVRITAGSSINYVKAVITPYNANGVAGETITVDYTVDQSQPSVEVYSCNALGQINVSGGGPINGYATSYIVDRGAVSYTRTDLMDNWHITAVRYCVVNEITWYEIYDTDDGDYYGWLDGDHIDFY